MHTSERKSGRNHLLGLAICVAMLTGMAGFSGCHKQAAATGQTANDSGSDPAAANLAPVDNSQPQTAGQPAVQGSGIQNESQQQAEQYQQGSQPQAPVAQQNDQYEQPNANDQAYEDEVDAGQQAVEEADQPPPPLPTYTQPEAPGPNYIWTPGYWSYAPLGYYWVPGAWVAAPYYGALWTPGYWGFYGGRYRFYRGYWGPHIGFYGGVNYGFGYVGTGYYGGYWNGNNFYYNRSVNRVNTSRIPNVYNRAVTVNNRTRVAYNGGRGGIQASPNRSELVAMHGPRVPPMTAQLQNQKEAAQNRQQFFNQNKGRPAMAAAARPLVADRGIQRPVARPMPATRPGQPNQIRPGQPNQIRPGQPNQVRPGEQNRPQVRPNQPQVRPNQPQVRPAQPQQRPEQIQNRPNQQVRPTQPQARPTRPETRPAQPEARPTQPQTRPVQPQTRPMQPQRSAQPQRQVQPQNRPEARPAPQQRPEARPTPQPRPQPQARPQTQERPQPQARGGEAPKEQNREAPRNDEHR